MTAKVPPQAQGTSPAEPDETDFTPAEDIALTEVVPPPTSTAETTDGWFEFPDLPPPSKDIGEAVTPAVSTRSRLKDTTEPSRGVMPVSFEIHTKRGYRMVTSTRADGSNAGFVGLDRFARHAHHIWLAALNDDPYALWYLHRMHQMLDDLHRSLGDACNRLGKKVTELNGQSKAKVQPFTSIQPTKFYWAAPDAFGYLGALIVLDLDSIERLIIVLTASSSPFHALMASGRVGGVSAKQISDTQANIHHAVQEVFNFPKTFTAFGVTHEDCMQRNARYLQAVAVMGELPDEWKNKDRRPQIAPAPHRVRAEQAALAPPPQSSAKVGG